MHERRAGTMAGTMISVVQRVAEASVEVAEDGYRAAIGRGLCVLLGIETGDSPADADWMAAKIANLRIFPDEQLKMNRSVKEIDGDVLVVSQFTLAGDCSRGNRPSFASAASPELGRKLYERVCEALASEHERRVATGVFGAMMHVHLINDGPVTLVIRRPPIERPASESHLPSGG